MNPSPKVPAVKPPIAMPLRHGDMTLPAAQRLELLRGEHLAATLLAQRPAGAHTQVEVVEDLARLFVAHGAHCSLLRRCQHASSTSPTSIPGRAAPPRTPYSASPSLRPRREGLRSGARDRDRRPDPPRDTQPARGRGRVPAKSGPPAPRRPRQPRRPVHAARPAHEPVAGVRALLGDDRASPHPAGTARGGPQLGAPPCLHQGGTHRRSPARARGGPPRRGRAGRLPGRAPSTTSSRAPRGGSSGASVRSPGAPPCSRGSSGPGRSSSWAATSTRAPSARGVNSRSSAPASSSRPRPASGGPGPTVAAEACGAFAYVACRGRDGARRDVHLAAARVRADGGEPLLRPRRGRPRPRRARLSTGPPRSARPRRGPVRWRRARAEDP